MAVTKNHAELGVVKKNGDVDILYLKNEGRDVAISRDQNAVIPSDVQTVQDLANKLKALAFGDGENLVYIGDGEVGSGTLPPMTEVDDNRLSVTLTWSSQKIYDNYKKFIPGYVIGTENKFDVFEMLYLAPTTFTVDTLSYPQFKSNTPDSNADAEWLVHYYPVTMDRYNVEGAPGSPNTLRTAWQEWIKVADTSGRPLVPVERWFRVYSGSQWQHFERLM